MGITEFFAIHQQGNAAAGRRLAGRLCGIGLAGLVCLSPPAAAALEGRVEVQGNRQDGGAGSTAYETSTLVENYSVGQQVQFARGLALQIDFLTRRQNLDNWTVAGSSNSEIVSLLPGATLTFRREGFRAGLSARGIRKDFTGTGILSRRDENADFGAWLRRTWTRIEVDLRARETSSQREAAGDSRDTREHLQGANLLLRPTLADELRYTFSRNVQELRSFGTEITFVSHNLQYRGGRGFADGRGRFSLDARTSRLRQTTGFRSGGGLEIVPPVWGGFSLDDTPTEWDPLEADPEFVGALFDQDRDTPTIVNLGDAAPVVRQYGGDYRNLIYDFGDVARVDELVLYVDTVLRFPELMQWRLLFSDDPEGRDWSSEAAPGQFSAVWFEQADGRQGWRFALAAPVSHRRLKLVESKLGPTEPDILVTELEVYQDVPAGAPDIEQTVRRDRLQGEIAYEAAPGLEVLYSANLSSRRFQESGGNVNDATHRFGANYTTGPWRVAASHEINRVRNTTGQDTDANSQHLSLSNSTSRTLQSRLSWSRTEDRSWTLSHRTQTVSGDVTWRPAPRLTVVQKVGFGTRDAISLGTDSRSWTLSTVVRGRLRPSFELELRRDDRWVSREAGAGFSSFNDTELQSTWALRPLLILSSQILYQVRDGDDVLVRNSLIWTPLPGGSLSFRLHASDLQDTRTEFFQRGGGGTVTWRPRPRLLLESGIEWVLVKQYDDRNTPTNLQFRGSWTL